MDSDIVDRAIEALMPSPVVVEAEEALVDISQEENKEKRKLHTLLRYIFPKLWILIQEITVDIALGNVRCIETDYNTFDTFQVSRRRDSYPPGVGSWRQFKMPGAVDRDTILLWNTCDEAAHLFFQVVDEVVKGSPLVEKTEWVRCTVKPNIGLSYNLNDDGEVGTWHSVVRITAKDGVLYFDPTGRQYRFDEILVAEEDYLRLVKEPFPSNLEREITNCIRDLKNSTGRERERRQYKRNIRKAVVRAWHGWEAESKAEQGAQNLLDLLDPLDEEFDNVVRNLLDRVRVELDELLESGAAEETEDEQATDAEVAEGAGEATEEKQDSE